MPVMNDATEQVLILNCRLLSFFLSNPDFQPPSFILQHPFLSFSETAREEDEMLLHLSSGEYKACSFSRSY